MKDKISQWQATPPSFVGRTMLIQSVTNSICSYIMTCYKLPMMYHRTRCCRYESILVRQRATFQVIMAVERWTCRLSRFCRRQYCTVNVACDAPSFLTPHTKPILPRSKQMTSQHHGTSSHPTHHTWHHILSQPRQPPRTKGSERRQLTKSSYYLRRYRTLRKRYDVPEE